MLSHASIARPVRTRAKISCHTPVCYCSLAPTRGMDNGRGEPDVSVQARVLGLDITLVFRDQAIQYLPSTLLAMRIF